MVSNLGVLSTTLRGFRVVLPGCPQDLFSFTCGLGCRPTVRWRRGCSVVTTVARAGAPPLDGAPSIGAPSATRPPADSARTEFTAGAPPAGGSAVPGRGVPAAATGSPAGLGPVALASGPVVAGRPAASWAGGLPPPTVAGSSASLPVPTCPGSAAGDLAPAPTSAGCLAGSSAGVLAPSPAVLDCPAGCPVGGFSAPAAPTAGCPSGSSTGGLPSAAGCAPGSLNGLPPPAAVAWSGCGVAGGLPFPAAVGWPAGGNARWRPPARRGGGGFAGRGPSGTWAGARTRWLGRPTMAASSDQLVGALFTVDRGTVATATAAVVKVSAVCGRAGSRRGGSCCRSRGTSRPTCRSRPAGRPRRSRGPTSSS